MSPDQEKILKKYGIIGGVSIFLLVASFFGGYYSHPANTTTKEEIQYVDRIVHETHTLYKDNVVDRVVYVESDSSHKEVEKTSKTITRKDGTQVVIVHEKDVSDKSKVVSNDTSHTETKSVDTTSKTSEDKKLTDSKTETVTYSKPDWKVSAGVGLDLGNLTAPQLPLVYSAEVDRRIIGTVSVGLEAQTNKVVSLKLGIEF
jgi:hypothetical protein